MEYESRPAFHLRGKRDDVRAFAAVGVLGLPGERPWQSRTTPLVGRASELSELLTGAHHAFATRTPTLATVLGDAGMGKTRLVLELQARLWEQLPAGLFLWGRCPSYGAHPAWPVAEVLRNVVGIELGVSRSEARETLRSALDTISGPDGRPVDDRTRDHVAQLLGIQQREDATVRDDADHEGTATIEELFRAALEVLEGLAAPQPTVVVLDDMHWAHDVLLAAISRFGRRRARVPLLVVAMGRTEVLERDPGFAAHGHLGVVLRPLTADEATDVLRHLLGAPGHPSKGAPRGDVAIEPGTRATILEAAGGNPFFLEELVSYLLDTDALVTADGTWRLIAEVAGALPDSVRAVLGARLATLPEAERRFLEDASVAGDHVASEAVADVAGWADDELREVVSALVRRGILERRPPDEPDDLAFRHVLIRDVVYASVPLAVRATAHARYAAWLERRYGMDLTGEALGSATNHYEQALDLGHRLDDHDPLLADRAWVALLRAANREAEHGSPAAAERLLRRARELTGRDHHLPGSGAAPSVGPTVPPP